jgi:hypothetical protein
MKMEENDYGYFYDVEKNEYIGMKMEPYYFIKKDRLIKQMMIERKLKNEKKNTTIILMLML